MINKMNCDELKEELKERKLPVSGRKGDLDVRLKMAMEDKVCLYTEIVNNSTGEDTDNFVVEDDCCYIVLKDKKIVTFYTNDVIRSPKDRVVSATDYVTLVDYVHGLAPLC